MFTGIVEEVGKVKGLVGSRLTIAAIKVGVGLRLGDSVAINGACLTVVTLDDETFGIDLSPETLRRTNLGLLRPGQGVNLELPLLANGRLGGHIVQGHVDATARYTSSKADGEFYLMSFRAPKRLMRYIVEKGFIAIDGASLTIVKKGATSFTVSVIPYTLQNTIMGDGQIGDLVNLEVDILAKYVASLLDKH